MRKTSPASRDKPRRTIGRPTLGSNAAGRAALVNAAAQLLARHPPNLITQVMVAATLGVHPSLIRYYFADRDALLIAAAEQIGAEFRERFDRELAKTDGDPEARLRERIRATLDTAIAYPFFHRLLVDEILHSEDPEADALFQRVRGRALDRYRAIIEDGVAADLFRPVTPVLLMTAIVGMCESFPGAAPLLQLGLGDAYDPEMVLRTYGDFLIDMVIAGIRAVDPEEPHLVSALKGENARLRDAVIALTLDRQALNEQLSALSKEN